MVAQGLRSLVLVSGSYSPVAVRWLLIAVASRCRAQAPGVKASAVTAHGLCSCGPGLVAPGMWDFPGPGIEPMAPALAGRFSTTGPPGKSSKAF